MIPVDLEHNGKKYHGVLSSPSGGGADVWDLTVNNSYLGALTFNQRNGWVYQTQKGRHDDTALLLGKFVEAFNPDRSFEAHLPPPFKSLSLISKVQISKQRLKCTAPMVGLIIWQEKTVS